MNSRLIRISREVSYALRHAPGEYGLDLDEEGFAPIDDLLASINARHPEQIPVIQGDLEEIITTSEKRRHEIVDGRIRALYGHSVGKTIERVPTIPPDILYHGTTHKALKPIMEEGLKPMGRQLVHLSADVEMAEQVGRRRDSHPVILQVDTASAYAGGTEFYLGNERVWLASSVPARYLSIVKLD